MKKLNEKLEIWWDSKSSTTLTLIGKSGIGKTAIVNQFAKNNNIPLYLIDLATMDELDLGGAVITNENSFKRVPFDQFYEANRTAIDQNREVIILLDELNRAGDAVFQALFKIISENHSAGELIFNPKVRFIATMNSGIEDGTLVNSSFMDDKASYRRLLITKVEPDIEAFFEYTTNNPNIIHPFFIRFLNMYKNHLHIQTEDNNAITSPASYEKISRLLKDKKGNWVMNYEEFLRRFDLFVNENLAPSTINEFRQYLKNNAIDLDAILKGKLKKGEPDYCIGVKDELFSYWKEKREIKENELKNVYNFFQKSNQLDNFIGLITSLYHIEVLKDTVLKAMLTLEEEMDNFQDWFRKGRENKDIEEKSALIKE